MADHKILAPFIRSWEGGIVNHPADRGGLTNRGVTMATWRTYCKQRGLSATERSLRAMTTEQWDEIFKTMYWDVCRADELDDQNVANMLVDWTYHSGRTAIVQVQRLLGTQADGIVGARTLVALNARPARELFDEIKRARTDYLKGIAARRPSQRVFLTGWLRRVDGITWGDLRINS